MIKREGYLLVDHRGSPGVTGEAPPNSVFESATRNCAHCQRVVVMNPLRTRERHSCRKCDAYICDDCAAAGECRPFVKLLDQAASAVEHGRPVPSMLINP